MGFLGFIKGIFKIGGRLTPEELARRLGVRVNQLQQTSITYQSLQIPKPNGGMRKLQVPNPQLKEMQRRILHKLLARLKSHPKATGFERNHSIVTNAIPHIGKAVIVKMDLVDFFTKTDTGRIEAYFKAIGWNPEAAKCLVRLCTYQNGLPQGAPTSPRLSNLVNYRLDERLLKLALSKRARYTRYADDMTFSFEKDRPKTIRSLIAVARKICLEEGYQVHPEKLRILRPHQRQTVTGLVVNSKVALPRRKRRWLRAIHHHLTVGKSATLTEIQLNGWRALHEMIAKQSAVEK